MSNQSRMPGELIYEHALQIEQVSDYGVALDRLLSGATAPPAEGARFDIHVEGTVTGPKVKGTVKGAPYSAPKRTSMRLAAALLAVVASLFVGPKPALATAAQHHDQAPFYRLKVGDLEVTALFDGPGVFDQHW